MKKRIVVLLSILCLLIVLPIAFGACSVMEEHQFSADWTGDDTHHWHAATCGHDAVSDKAEHTWDAGVPGEGGTVYTCTVCGRTKTVATAHEHLWTESGVTAPTCTEKGYTSYLCSCGETRRDKETAALGHEIASLTENGDGTHTGYCEREKATVTESCHYETKVTEPLCTEQGYTTYTCACGNSYRDDYTEPLGHSHAKKVVYNDVYHWYEATCSHVTEKLEFAAHTYTKTVTAPTCTEKGYTTYACECGYSYQGDFVAATGHTVDAWVEGESTLYDATLCKSAVLYRGECTVCHHEQTKIEYVEKHSFYWAITKPATCVEEGIKTKLCNHAGCKYHTASDASETGTYSDAEAHVWVKDEDASSANVTVYTCEHHASVTKSVMTAADSSVNVSGSELGGVNELEFPDASLEFDDGIKSNLSTNNNVSISAGKLEGDAKQDAIDDANLSPEELELLGDNPIYNFTITAGTEISQLGGTATIRIPYTLTPGQNPEQIVVWYISEGELKAYPATYGEDASGVGYVTFTTTHFSCYVPAEIDAVTYCEIYGHSSETFTVAPTCTESGYTVCLHCGKQIAMTAPTGHNFHSTVSQKPSCDENGKMHFSCDGCDVAYDTVIPATGHYYVLHDHKSATCKEAGSDTYRCVFCEDGYTLSIKQIKHEHTVTVVEPTCTSAGYTQKICRACGDTVILNHTKALAHSYSAVWTGAEEGHYHVCTECGTRSAVEAHAPGAEATEQSAQICTVCDYVITPPIAHVHKLTEVKAEEPDCTHGGNLAYYTCTCGKWFLDEKAEQLVTDHASIYLLAKGHTPVSIAPVEPDCDTVGYTAGVECSVCHEILKGHDEIAAYGHRYVATVKAPTCTEGGYTDYACKCGDTYRDNETDPMDHSYISAVTAPTCTEGGFTTHTCARCAHSYTDAETEALDHTPSMTISADENGHWVACTRCGVKLEEGEHTPDHAEATEVHGITCTVCGYEIAEALPHTHTSAKEVAGKAPTCTATGVKGYYVCACGKWFEDEACTKAITDPLSVILPVADHKIETVDATASTCRDHGYTAGERCTDCGKWFSGHEKLPLGEHTYQNNICTVCGNKQPIYIYTDEDKEYNMTTLYEFFSDHTVRGYMEYIDEAGNVNSMEDFAEWIQKDNGIIVIVYDGKELESFTIGEDGKTLIPYEEPPVEKKVLYTYETQTGSADVVYTFYSDNTVCATVTINGQVQESFAEWTMNGNEIAIVYQGEIVERFTVDANGVLTPVAPEQPDPSDKELQYTYHMSVYGYAFVYNFYTDNTVCITATIEGSSADVWAEWYVDGNLIVVEYEGQIDSRYTVDENGVLTLFKEEIPDLSEKELVYTYTQAVEGVEIYYAFYADNTAYGRATMNGETSETMLAWTMEEGLVVAIVNGEPALKFTVNEDGKTLTLYVGDSETPGPDPDATVLYTFSLKTEAEEAYYEFYSDYTVRAQMILNGDPITVIFNWTMQDAFVVLLSEGEEIMRFTVNEDGETLTLYVGDSETPGRPTDKEIAYSYEEIMEEGKMLCEFYTDNTMYVYMASNQGAVMECLGTWELIDGLIYGTVDGDTDAMFIVNEDGSLSLYDPDGNGEEKKIVYSFYGTIDGYDLTCEFYADGTMYVYDNYGGEVSERYGTWVEQEGLIYGIFEGETEAETMFYVNEDGSLTLYASGSDDTTVVYDYYGIIDGIEMLCEFYADGTMYIMGRYNGQTQEFYGTWEVIEGLLYGTVNGDTETMFYVNADGSLTLYDGGNTDNPDPVEKTVVYIFEGEISGATYSLTLYNDGTYMGSRAQNGYAGMISGDWRDRNGSIVVISGSETMTFSVNEDGKTLTFVSGSGSTPSVRVLLYTFNGYVNGTELTLMLYDDYTFTASYPMNDMYASMFTGNWHYDVDQVVAVTGMFGTLRFTVNEDGKTLSLVGGEEPPVLEKNVVYIFNGTVQNTEISVKFYNDYTLEGSYLQNDYNIMFSGSWSGTQETITATTGMFGSLIFEINPEDQSLTLIGSFIPVDPEPEPDVLYNYKTMVDGFEIEYSFYSDGTGRMNYVIPDVGYTRGAWFDWTEENKQLILFYDGLEAQRFTILTDGTIAPDATKAPNPPAGKTQLYFFENEAEGRYDLYFFYDDKTAYCYVSFVGGMAMELEATWDYIDDSSLTLIYKAGENYDEFTINADGSLTYGREELETKELYAECVQTWESFLKEMDVLNLLGADHEYVIHGCEILEKMSGVTVWDEAWDLSQQLNQVMTDIRMVITVQPPAEPETLYTFDGMVNEWILTLTFYADYTFGGTYRYADTTASDAAGAYFNGGWYEENGNIVINVDFIGIMTFVANEGSNTLSFAGIKDTTTEDLTNLIKERYTQLQKEWRIFLAETDAANVLGSDHSAILEVNDLLKKLREVASVEELDYLTNRFYDLQKEITHAINDLPSVEPETLYTFDGMVNNVTLRLTLFSDFTYEGTYAADLTAAAMLMVRGTWWYENEGMVIVSNDAFGTLKFTVNEDSTLTFDGNGSDLSILINERYTKLLEEWEMLLKDTNAESILGADCYEICTVRDLLIKLKECTSLADMNAITNDIYKYMDTIREMVKDAEQPADREVVYNHTLNENGIDVFYTFYSDGTCTMSYFLKDDTGNAGETMMHFDWYAEKDLLIVTMDGMEMTRFTLNADKTLTLQDPIAFNPPADSALVYSYEVKRSDMQTFYYFYEDNSVYLYTSMIGGIAVEDTAKWFFEEDILVIDYQGDTAMRFTVDENNELTPYYGNVNPPVGTVYVYDDGYYYFEFYSDGTAKGQMPVDGANGTAFNAFMFYWIEENGTIRTSFNGKVYLFTVCEDKSLMLEVQEESEAAPTEEQIRVAVEHVSNQWKLLEQYEAFFSSGLHDKYLSQYEKTIEQIETAESMTTIESAMEKFDTVIQRIKDQLGVGSGEDVEAYRANTEEWMNNRWTAYNSDDRFLKLPALEDYQNRFDKIYEGVKSAATVSELDEMNEQANRLFEEIDKMLQEEISCAHENRDLMHETAATCNMDGRIVWFCHDCVQEIEEIIPATGMHEYADGACIHCGQSEFIEPDIPTDGMIYTYDEDSEGMSRHIRFFADYHADVEIYVGTEMVFYIGKWAQEGNMIHLDYNGVQVSFIVENGMLTKYVQGTDTPDVPVEPDIPADGQIYFVETSTAESDVQIRFYTNGTAMVQIMFFSTGEMQTQEASWYQEGSFVYLDFAGQQLCFVETNGNLSYSENAPEAFQQFVAERYAMLNDQWQMFLNEYDAETVLGKDHELIQTVYKLLNELPNAMSYDEVEYYTSEIQMAMDNIRIEIDSGMGGGSTENPGDNWGDIVSPDLPGDSGNIGDNGNAGVGGNDPEGSYDFGGEEIVILVPTTATTNWDMLGDETGATMLSQAVYERNRMTEEKLNVILQFRMTEASVIQNMQLADLEEADLISYNAAALSKGMINGYYQNLRNSEFINIDAPWWNESYNEAASQFGSQYLLTGDLNLVTYDQLGVVYFNYYFMLDYEMEDLYTTVLNGEWTIEKLQEYASLCYGDLNGDDLMDSNDLLGLVGKMHGNAASFLRAGGIQLVAYDEANDIMRVNANEQAMDLMDRISELWNMSGTYRVTSSAEIYAPAASGNAMFVMDILNDPNKSALSASQYSFGVLPMPKMSVDQAEYASNTNASYSAIAVINDCEAVGAVLDTMGAHSESLLETYKQSILRTLYDAPEAQDVLNIIIDNVTWDYLSVYDAAAGNATNFLWTNAFTKSQPLMSLIQMNMASVNAKLEEFETVLKR